MRSITTQLKVEGHETLQRDVSSNAIINTDEHAYASYLIRKNQEKKQKQELQELRTKVDNLSTDMSEIKELLQALIKANK